MSLCSGITHKQMMMISGSSNNHKNHGQVGQEVAARSPDAPAVPDDVENGGQEVDRLPPTGLATNNHPEEPEEEHSANNSLCGARSLAAIILAVVGVIGVALSVVSPASSNETINVASKQVAVVATAPIDNYKAKKRPGRCLDKEKNLYPAVQFYPVTLAECFDRCKCAQDIDGVTYRGFSFRYEDCYCHMDWLGPNPDQAVIDELNTKCTALDDTFSGYADRTSSGNEIVLADGSGKMKSTDNTAGYTC